MITSDSVGSKDLRTLINLGHIAEARDKPSGKCDDNDFERLSGFLHPGPFGDHFGVFPAGDESCDIEGRAYLFPPAPDASLTLHVTRVVCMRRKPCETGDLPPVGASQFGEFADQNRRDDLSNAGSRLQLVVQPGEVCIRLDCAGDLGFHLQDPALQYGQKAFDIGSDPGV